MRLMNGGAEETLSLGKAKTTAATYEKTGIKTYSCTRCTATKTESVPMKTLSKPVVTLTNASTGIKLSWGKVTGAKGYYVYRGSTLIKTITSGTTVLFVDTAAVSGKKYSYTVKAYAGSNASQASASVSLTYISGTAISAVQNQSGSVKINWNRNSLASGYKLYRSKDGEGFKLLKKITSGVTTTYTDTAVVNGSKYEYRIQAYVTTGEKEVYSAISGIKTIYYAAPVLVSSAENLKNGINLAWNKNSKVTGYQIYRSEAGADYKFLKTITANTTLSYIDTSTKNGIRYQYKIRAYRSVGDTKYYGAYSSIKQIYRLESSAISQITAGTTSLTVKWSRNSSATGYKLYRNEDGGSYKPIKTITGNTTLSYTDTAVTNGVKYQYKLVTYKTVSSVTYLSAISVKTSYYLKAPTISTITSSTSGTKITWDKNASATGYKIYRSVDGMDYKLYKTISGTATVSYLDSMAAIHNTKYQYKVVAYKTVGSVSYSSAYSNIKTLTYKAKLAISYVGNDKAGGLTVKWNEVKGVIKYAITIIGADGKKYTRYIFDGSNSYEFTGLSVGLTYTVTVEAILDGSVVLKSPEKTCKIYG